MAKTQKSENVPKAMQATFDRIVALTDDFAQQHLNAEYAQTIRFATAALCRKRPSPLVSGQAKTWACGITHAIGMANYLYDPSQTPHLKASAIYSWFGVAASTGQAKSKLVRDALRMNPLDPEWCLPSKLGNNPLAWLVLVDGFLTDARNLPRAVQEALCEHGMIPYVPGDRDEGEGEERDVAAASALPPANSVTPATPRPSTGSASPQARFTLEVLLLDGPMTEKFANKNPEVSRTIHILGSNTLADLHAIIFKAFNREDEHLYEFQVGGHRPHDPAAKRYGLAEADDETLTGDVSATTIAALGLSVGERFSYWFDFGDDWWHQIRVAAIEDNAPKGKYPKIIGRVGASPPQYANFD